MSIQVESEAAVLHPMTCYMHRPSFLWILLGHPPPKFNKCAVERNELLLARRAYARASTRARQGTRFSGRFLVVGAIHDGANARETASTAIQQHNPTAFVAPNADDRAWAVLMLARLSGEANLVRLRTARLGPSAEPKV